jgi:hypothetical protein
MMSFFLGLLLGYIIGVFYMAHRSNTDTRTNIE